MPSTYLAHHGILGQKWGVRRYQNPDGSLTEAGKKRYLKADGSFKKSKRSFGLATRYDSDTYRNMSDYYTNNGRGNLTHKGEIRYNKTLKDLKTKQAQDYLSSRKGSKARNFDLEAFGPGGVERIAKRLDKGVAYNTARKKEPLLQVAVGTGASVALWVAPSSGPMIASGVKTIGSYLTKIVGSQKAYSSKKAAGLLLAPVKVFNTDTGKWVTL